MIEWPTGALRMMACTLGGNSRRPIRHCGYRDTVNFSIYCEASEEENKMPPVKVMGIA